MNTVSRLSGRDWQVFADNLLSIRYGAAEYQRIPDKDQGDAGIEGFTISKGHAYQIYGPVEPLTTKERYKKLRTKMTTDIRKFCENRETLSELFGDIKITRWILLVPHFDSKEIVTHASKKTKEVVEANLPYVSPEFRVVVMSEDDFNREKALVEKGINISITGPEIEQAQITKWADENDSLVETIEDKIKRIKNFENNNESKKLRENIIRFYLDYQNVLEELRKYPIIHENIWTIINQKERYLEMKTLMSTETNLDLFRECLEDTEEAVKSEVSGIAPTTIHTIVYGTVSDWIIRCPLDFKRTKAE
jgi:hypothetical protein